MTPQQRLLVAIIRGYQTLLSPILGHRCRFHPTCSAYMAEAISTRGVASGLWLGLSRLKRCHPWADGGHDPLPNINLDSPVPCTNNAKAEQ